MRTVPPSADWIEKHRRVWARKPALRSVYQGWFRTLREACVPDTSVVEIGCGPGFFKELYPEVLATDVVPNPYADRVVDAEALPFSDGEVGNIVMLDVFHHLRSPREFLSEVARVLPPGGHLAMIEPWIGLAGIAFYRWVHHEACDLAVDPNVPCGDGSKAPMDGNVALPCLYFGSGGHLGATGLPLRILRRRPFAGLTWLLSGGFQPRGLLPVALVPMVEAIDGVLSRFPKAMATRALIVVERID